MTQKITAIIVDDEALSVDVIAEYLKPFNEIQVIGKFTKSTLALEQILNLKPDLLFLDIQMPKLDGFQLLETVIQHYNPHIIFITAFDQYAIKAFDTNAIGYILKPIEEQKFNTSISKTLHLFKQNNQDIYQNLKQLLEHQSAAKNYLNKILIKEPKRLFYISIDEVFCFEASGDYVSVVTTQKTYLINESLTALENKLDPNNFIRIHRSTIVSSNHIKEFLPYFNGEYTIVLNNNKQVKVSRNYKENLNKIFKEL